MIDSWLPVRDPVAGTGYTTLR